MCLESLRFSRIERYVFGSSCDGGSRGYCGFRGYDFFFRLGVVEEGFLEEELFTLSVERDLGRERRGVVFW